MKTITLLALTAWVAEVHAYWRLSCGQIQTGRIDPLLSPGIVSNHTHVIAGAYNANPSTTNESMAQAYCTSCSIQADKSIYWTPLLYYKSPDGKFTPVKNSATVVYYLARGAGGENTVPFPKGFRMLSGNPFLRSYNTTAKALGDATHPGSPLAKRVSFVCIKSYMSTVDDDDDPGSDAPRESRSAFMNDTDCVNGLRAQITFPSCWNGQDLYKTDQSHVAYLSDIQNGVCPPSHPVRIPHLFYELYYYPNAMNPAPGGQFVFAQGDPTGYGFHGDFMNGWDQQVLADGIDQCLHGQKNPSGQVEKCAPFVPSIDSRAPSNCPEQPAYWDEPVRGTLDSLPGCNPIQPGPALASVIECQKFPAKTNAQKNLDGRQRTVLTPGTTKYNTPAGVATYKGCFTENSSGRWGSVGRLDNTTGMTIEMCANYCKTQKNVNWFGLQYAQECYCGTTLPTTTQLTEDQCNYVCKGDISQWCGAGSKNSIYQLAGSTSRIKRSQAMES